MCHICHGGCICRDKGRLSPGPKYLVLPRVLSDSEQFLEAAGPPGSHSCTEGVRKSFFLCKRKPDVSVLSQGISVWDSAQVLPGPPQCSRVAQPSLGGLHMIPTAVETKSGSSD